MGWPGPSAGFFPGKGSMGLGPPSGLLVLAAAEIAQKRIFPNYLYFRNEKGREMRREKKKESRKKS